MSKVRLSPVERKRLKVLEALFGGQAIVEVNLCSDLCRRDPNYLPAGGFRQQGEQVVCALSDRRLATVAVEVEAMSPPLRQAWKSDGRVELVYPGGRSLWYLHRPNGAWQHMGDLAYLPLGWLVEVEA